MSILQPHDLESEQFEPLSLPFPSTLTFSNQERHGKETQAAQTHPMERFAI